MRDGKLPRAKRVLVVDAAGTVLGATLGTSTIVSFIESAAGVSAGGRTGLTAVVAGSLFFVALFFSPLIGMVANYPPVTAPALLTLVGIPLAYSIADGLALGFISYPVLKALSGRGRDIGAVSYVVAVLLIVYFVFVRSRLG